MWNQLALRSGNGDRMNQLERVLISTNASPNLATIILAY